MFDLAITILGNCIERRRYCNTHRLTAQLGRNGGRLTLGELCHVIFTCIDTAYDSK